MRRAPADDVAARGGACLPLSLLPPVAPVHPHPSFPLRRPGQGVIPHEPTEGGAKRGAAVLAQIEVRLGEDEAIARGLGRDCRRATTSRRRPGRRRRREGADRSGVSISIAPSSAGGAGVDGANPRPNIPPGPRPRARTAAPRPNARCATTRGSEGRARPDATRRASPCSRRPSRACAPSPAPAARSRVCPPLGRREGAQNLNAQIHRAG